MIDIDRAKGPSQYDVVVGHQRVRVTGWSPEEAIGKARRALCAQLPRLYDVIRRLDKSRFEVVAVVES